MRAPDALDCCQLSIPPEQLLHALVLQSSAVSKIAGPTAIIMAESSTS